MLTYINDYGGRPQLAFNCRGGTVRWRRRKIVLMTRWRLVDVSTSVQSPGESDEKPVIAAALALSASMSSYCSVATTDNMLLHGALVTSHVRCEWAMKIFNWSWIGY
ncbi:hypothetical protein M8494_27330 [Serratia ureilytica]